ncbi:putative disease resistance protein [Camellia lanceoleosa]|uniref:Disease resistance protein n=1 Tax=Camellia lanceoleosa TaxID=1840588 RepID=A0ACC0H8F8_9ERIC|nr:putative disease resistance protein [Camellia lanceoleosa]
MIPMPVAQEDSSIGVPEASTKEILIGVLGEPEAWTLFKKTVGISIDSEIPFEAKEVCDKCGGLPVAICAVAAALKGKGKHAWKDALRQLKNYKLKEIAGIDLDLYISLKWSYDRLEPKDARSCFFLCSLFPEDAEISIDDLVAFPALKELRIFDVYNISVVVFPCLEVLEIWSLGNIEEIWHSTPPTNSFNNLRHLAVVDCQNLLNIAPSELLGSLQNLQFFYVEDCVSLKERRVYVPVVVAALGSKGQPRERNATFLMETSPKEIRDGSSTIEAASEQPFSRATAFPPTRLYAVIHPRTTANASNPPSHHESIVAAIP